MLVLYNYISSYGGPFIVSPPLCILLGTQLDVLNIIAPFPHSSITCAYLYLYDILISVAVVYFVVNTRGLFTGLFAIKIHLFHYLNHAKLSATVKECI